jgi:hypothetical protein
MIEKKDWEIIFSFMDQKLAESNGHFLG